MAYPIESDPIKITLVFQRFENSQSYYIWDETETRCLGIYWPTGEEKWLPEFASNAKDKQSTITPTS